MTAEPAPMTEAKEQEPTKAAAFEGAVDPAGPPVALASEEGKPIAGDADKKGAVEDAEREDASSGGDGGTKLEEKCGSFREESNSLSDLKENEKKALLELRALLEEAIVGNKLFKKDVATTKATATVKEEVKGGGEKKASEVVAAAEVKTEDDKGVSGDGEKVEAKEEIAEEKPAATSTGNTPQAEGPKSDATSTEANAAAPKPDEPVGEKKPAVDSAALKSDAPVAEEKHAMGAPAALKSNVPDAEEKHTVEAPGASSIPDAPAAEDKPAVETAAGTAAEVEPPVDKDISLWGVPLLPSKDDDATNAILLKFLRARDFRPKDALEMLSQTLQWRKSFGTDTILEDTTLGAGLDSAAYMDDGVDREGHPICYNVYGVFQDADLYQRTFGSEEKTEQFLRWRFQLMEKGIKRLDFRPGGTASILQVTDLKNAPGVSKKELRIAMKRAVALLQDNYPEFVARNIFINVPFWYYAFNALLSPFLTQRTKSKFVFTRPARVTETLLRYIPAEEIPLRYGGLRRDGDEEFRAEDGGVMEVAIKGSSTETIELPAPEVGMTLLWDVTVVGWEVSYKEEFVPDDEGSYTVIVQKVRKMAVTDSAVRNSFRNNEPGKVVLTIENSTFKRKKALYRYKVKSTATPATLKPQPLEFE